MIVKNLTLKNFRNHDYSTYEFQKGLNIIHGPNGIGKTNIVEAIYYLSTVKSFRTTDDSNLIKNGVGNAEINASISEGEITRKIRVMLSKDGKRILLNNKPIIRFIVF